MIKGIIFDFNRTIYDPDNDCLIPGVLDLLNDLKDKGYKMCLISKSDDQESRIKQIKNLGVYDFFVKVEVEDSKDQEQFINCQRIMDMDFAEILVIGDRVLREIEIGNSLGMLTIWYRQGKFAEELPQNDRQKPKYIITNFKEVLNIIE